ncbi:MAG: phosphoribosylglycinamide synthetase C domain-containing protein, partial [Candidatus Bathyarchaeia archaeon]
PFYIAFIHTREGVKVLEINSRPGDPEILNILPVMRDDLVEVCFKILDGHLKRVDLESKATVAIYKVPPSYGGFIETYPERVDKDQLGRPVDSAEAKAMADRDPTRLRIYPASLELRDGQIYPLGSRAICAVGIADSIQEARGAALEALERIRGGALWYRRDVASQDHINRSIARMRSLRKHDGHDG